LSSYPHCQACPSAWSRRSVVTRHSSGGARDHSSGGARVTPQEAQQRDTKNTKNQIEGEKREASSLSARSRRCAPLHSNAERSADAEPATAFVRDPVRYDAAVRASKRRNWLSWINHQASKLLRGHEREEAWRAIAAASQADTRAATPKWALQVLDAL